MLTSGTGLSWSKKFGIVQGIAHQSAAQAGGPTALSPIFCIRSRYSPRDTLR
jgi:hypothetical protein